LKKFKATGSITRKPGTGRKPTKTRALLDFIDTEIEKDDEISLADLRTKLVEKGINVSISSIHRWKEELGWTSKGTKYCQMIREGNVAKRLDWAKANVEDINLDDLIFTDKTTVQLAGKSQANDFLQKRPKA
jgi:transposase